MVCVDVVCVAVPRILIIFRQHARHFRVGRSGQRCQGIYSALTSAKDLIIGLSALLATRSTFLEYDGFLVGDAKGGGEAAGDSGEGTVGGADVGDDRGIAGSW